MTKAFSILHRAAALLATLCLLAGMALPVYATQDEPIFFGPDAETIPTVTAETTAEESTEPEQNPVVTDSETVPGKENTPPAANEPETIVQSTETVPNNDGKTQETADEHPPAANNAPDADNNTTNNKDTAADNAPADNNAAAADKNADADKDATTDKDATADAEKTTAAKTNTEQGVLFAEGDAPDVTALETSGYTLYFVAPTAWDGDLSNADAHLYFNVNFHDNEWQQAEMTQIGTTAGCRLYAINFVPRLECTTICTCQFQCYVGTAHKAQFQPISNTTTSLTSLVGRVYDGTKSAWFDYQKEYAGKALYFKNDSTAELTSVKAVFYTWDWQSKKLQQVEEQEIGMVAAGTQSEVQATIPQTACGFVEFTWADGKSALYNYGNIQYTAENAPTASSIGTQNRFTYGGGGNETWDKASSNILAAGKTIYFDSTLSSYTYTGDNEIKQNAMPETRNGGNGKIYCFLQKTDGSYDRVEMTSAADPKAADRQLWSYTIPQGASYTAVQFSAWESERPAKDDMTKLWSEDEIPPTLQDPCFFADDGDPSAYTNGDVYRNGYWGEKASVRDAESGKGTTVVDIKDGTFTQEPGTKYITSTLYDYYTDYELNGLNRDTYSWVTTSSQRGYVTFEQFNRALSSAYTANGNVKYPLYTGHFQKSGWGDPFATVAKDMGLYGWDGDTNSPKYKTFMAVNNSALDDNGKESADYRRTFQGLVEDKTSDSTADGLPLLRTENSTGSTTGALADPHFNKGFLQGKNAFNTVLGKVYENVSFPLKQKPVFATNPENPDPNEPEGKAEYWYYDSSKSSLYLKQNQTDGKYYLESPKGDDGNPTTDSKSQNISSPNSTNGTHGFFPFNQTVNTVGASQYNYGFGAKLQFDFTLTKDGNVVVGKDTSGKDVKVPIKFFFSGDDDVWVYIDGELMLDVGGAHGKASGLLEFGPNNTVTPYVSSNKNTDQNDTMVYKGYEPGETPKTVKYNGQPITFSKKGPTKPLKDQSTHTLTMYYMERGMWESNMALAFNFPDHKELQVEKQVDVSGVNPLFQKSFKNQKIFTFNIQNLATHYGTTAAYTPTIETYGLPDNVYSSATRLSYESLPSEVGTGSAVLWSSNMNDPTSVHRAERRGTLTLDSAKNISPFSYLTFDVYVKGDSSETCALSNLYVELWDTDDKQMGCLGTKGLQSSDVYGAATALHPGTWYTVRLMLNSLKKDEHFNNQLTKITVGDNYNRSIYLRNFTFSSAPTLPKQTGFTTAQYDVPDYGSAESGKLENAAFAVFSSNLGNGDVVDENGQFLLQDGETVTFHDQFRRGSYIALKEQIDPELYDTTWTVYENGVPVTSVGGKPDVVEKGSVDTLKNIGTTAPNDGRTEKVVDTDLDGNNTLNKYTEDKKPNADMLVFRSYSNSADDNELTKLKVVFTNKVKTGKLVIRKVPAAGEETQLEGKTFNFTIRFGDVGGQSLGGIIPEMVYPCKVEKHKDGYYGQIVIDKIPVGTRFVVSEDVPADTSLKSVNIVGGKDCKVSADSMAYGAIAEGNENAATATFENTTRKLIDITVKKVWQKQDQGGTVDIPQADLPAAIYLRLQRTETPNDPKSWQTVTGCDRVELKPDAYKGWIHLFTGLDKNDAGKTGTDRVDYTYRVLESATGKDDDWHGSGDVIKIDGKRYKVLNTPVKADSDNITLTLTNQLQDAKYNLVITKLDAQDKSKLVDVEFKLEKLDAEPSETKTGKTNGTGELTFAELTPGSYRLTETKTAEGYTLLAKPIEFTLTADGHYQRGDETREITPGADGVYNIALTVYNRKGFTLPHTGADAPSLWLLIGLPALVAVLLVLVFRYNKKGGKHS